MCSTRFPRGDSGKIERGRRGCARSGRARRVRALLEPRRKPPRRSFSVAHARSGRDQAPPRRGSQPHLTGRAKRRSTRRRTPRDVPRVPVPRDRPRSLRAFARAASRSPQLPRRARIGRAWRRGAHFWRAITSRKPRSIVASQTGTRASRKISLLQCVRSLEKGLSSEVFPEMILFGSAKIPKRRESDPIGRSSNFTSGRFSFSPPDWSGWTRPASFFVFLFLAKKSFLSPHSTGARGDTKSHVRSLSNKRVSRYITIQT